MLSQHVKDMTFDTIKMAVRAEKDDVLEALLSAVWEHGFEAAKIPGSHVLDCPWKTIIVDD